MDTNKYSINVSSWADIMQSMSELNYLEISKFSETLNNTMLTLNSIFSDEYICSFQEANKVFLNKLKAISETILQLDVQNISERLKMPEESISTIGDEIVPMDETNFSLPKQTDGKGKILTLDNISKLVSMIAAIVTIIYYAHAMLLEEESHKYQQAENERKNELLEETLGTVNKLLEYIDNNRTYFFENPSGFVEQIEPFIEQSDTIRDASILDSAHDNADGCDDVHN